MNPETLKELFPEMTNDQRQRVGMSLADYGVTRIGSKVKEGGYLVNRYHPDTHDFITKYAIELFKS